MNNSSLSEYSLLEQEVYRKLLTLGFASVDSPYLTLTSAGDHSILDVPSQYGLIYFKTPWSVVYVVDFSFDDGRYETNKYEYQNIK